MMDGVKGLFQIQEKSKAQKEGIEYVKKFCSLLSGIPSTVTTRGQKSNFIQKRNISSFSGNHIGKHLLSGNLLSEKHKDAGV